MNKIELKQYSCNDCNHFTPFKKEKNNFIKGGKCENDHSFVTNWTKACKNIDIKEEREKNGK